MWLVFANVLALQIGLPVPAYPALIVVGAFSSRGDFSLMHVVAVAVSASLVADLVWFFAGRRFGRRVLRLMCRLSLSPDSCVRQTERIYERWGAPSLMFAKFVPGFAAVATGMAGAMRTSLARFILFDAIGALAWSGVAASLGWLFRDAVDDLIVALAQAGRWGLVLLTSTLVAYVFWGPMAIAIMGGLVVATALTLVFVPALYAAWFRVRRAAARGILDQDNNKSTSDRADASRPVSPNRSALAVR